MAYTIEEEEDLNRLKAWWSENGKVIIVAIIVAVVAVMGWRFWQSHQYQQQINASAIYDQLIYNADQDSQQQSQKVAEFVQANGQSGYAVFALLDEAKNAVAREDFTQAENVLKQAVTQTKDALLVSISALRLAAVQFQLQQFDNALASLNQVKLASFDSRKHILIGDIQLAKGDKDSAKASFELALSASTSSALEQQIARMRLNNL